MKVNVNLFKPGGKWAYGGVVDVDESIPFWTEAHRQDIINKQDFVVDGAFADHLVVVSHRDNYDEDPSSYFCQYAWPAGAFFGMRRT